MSTLLALDPSFMAPSYAVFDLGIAKPTLIAAGIIQTARAAEHKRESIALDDLRRVRFIRRSYREVFQEFSPVLVACESMGGSKNAVAVKGMAFAQAVVACLVDELLGATPIYITALEATDALGLARTQRRKKGDPPKSSRQAARERKDRKAAIAEAVVERLGVEAWTRVLEIDEGEVLDPNWEGAYDAAAVGLAVWEHPSVAAERARAKQMTLAPRELELM